MRFHCFLSLCLLGTSLASSPQQRRFRRDTDVAVDPLATAPVASATSANDTVPLPKRYILELKDGASLDSLTSHANLRVVRVFDSDVFRGAAVETDEDNVDTLSALPAVGQAWQSRRVTLEPMKPELLVGGLGAGHGTKLSRDTSPALDVTVHHMTGVDELHARGIRGKGVQIAVVDTGIDYTHPALGGGFGAGKKVAGGYDLVGNGNWPAGPKAPDDDPMDQTGHGTHVAGIIAAEDSLFVGVAPDATLMAYKVFSKNSGTDEDTLIESFLRAYDDGADIITSSIGGINGWTDNAWALVASRLVERGIVVTISAGNDGDVGAFTASSGSSGANVVAVASVEADRIAVPRFLATFQSPAGGNGTAVTDKIIYRASSDWASSDVKGWPFHAITLDTTVANDACNALPSDTPDLSRVVVLVRRGGCEFALKQRNLEAKGAKSIVFYSNESPLVIPSSANPIQASNISMIQAEDGARIIEAIKQGGTVLADFDVPLRESMVGLPVPAGRVASTFTSQGTTNELAIKPDVAGPGGQIFSTYLGGGYATLSGTSMSCPYVAGVAALYISQHGNRFVNGPGYARDLAMRLISSAEPVRWDDGNESGADFGAWAPVSQIGTGLINATKVLDYSTSLSLSRFALNDTHHFSRYHKVNVTNKGTGPVTYTFEQQEFSGVQTLLTDPDTWGTPRMAWFSEMAALGPQAMAPSVSFPRSFTLKPGESKTAQFNFEPPQGLNASVLPLYGGRINIKGSNGEVLGVPYMGLAADLHRDIGNMFPDQTTITTTSRKLTLDKKANTTFNTDVAASDFPDVYVRLQYATTELRLDVYEASYTERDWAYPPTVGQRKYVGAVTSYSKAEWGGKFDPATMNASDTFNLPLRNVPRSVSGQYGLSLWWFGQLANGSTIAPGKYRLRLAALVPFGTPENADNWSVYQAPVFEVLPKV